MVTLDSRVKRMLTFAKQLAEEAKGFNEAAEREPAGSMCLGNCFFDGPCKLRRHPT
jgi:hypothetical protein